jgi:hypothetical protein
VGEEAERDTTGEGRAADDEHRRHRRRGEVGLGSGFSLCCALARRADWRSSLKAGSFRSRWTRTVARCLLRLSILALPLYQACRSFNCRLP